jgi:hypothetical protein
MRKFDTTNSLQLDTDTRDAFSNSKCTAFEHASAFLMHPVELQEQSIRVQEMGSDLQVRD